MIFWINATLSDFSRHLETQPATKLRFASKKQSKISWKKIALDFLTTSTIIKYLEIFKLFGIGNNLEELFISRIRFQECNKPELQCLENN